jgi:uncharacterized protein (TIGR00297 family)
LDWQSKLILLLVVPCTAVSLALMALGWAMNEPMAAAWTLGLSALLGVAAWASRSGSPAAAATGGLILASLMVSTAELPFRPWRSVVVPVLLFLVMTSLATRFGRRRKERLGIAEGRHGRVAAQVAANLGCAALVLNPAVRLSLGEIRWLAIGGVAPALMVAAGLASLAEAAADTISSEIGQVLGGRPVMLTTLRRVDAGTDGAISVAGTAAGVAAAAVVAASGAWALHGDMLTFRLSWTGGVFGLFFDSLLGATAERWGWLNNDAVNFLSTASAAGFTLAVLALAPRPCLG